MGGADPRQIGVFQDGKIFEVAFNEKAAAKYDEEEFYNHAGEWNVVKCLRGCNTASHTETPTAAFLQTQAFDSPQEGQAEEATAEEAHAEEAVAEEVHTESVQERVKRREVERVAKRK